MKWKNAARKRDQTRSMMCGVQTNGQYTATKNDDDDDDELKINSKTMFNARIQNPLNKNWNGGEKKNIEVESWFAVINAKILYMCIQYT